MKSSCSDLARQRGDVGPEPLREREALGIGETGALRRWPQVLFDRVPAGPLFALRNVRLAGVGLGVKVAERFGDGLHAFPVDARVRVQRARFVVVTALVRVHELVCLRHERLNLFTHVEHVLVRC